ncbi:hypothetical protein H4R35_000328 [Dimargaris xerosporica]|nr:hypothetical protein H4R35_000328 [Dimargaris xerosporica]
MDHIEGAQQHRVAAAIVQAAIRDVLAKVTPGTAVESLCQLGDDIIEGYAQQLYPNPKLEKGVAFPTSITLNSQVQNISPAEGASLVISVGDVVKVELAAQVEGYVASQAHTMVVNLSPDQPINDRRADVVCAAKIANEAAIRTLHPGAKASQVTAITQEVAKIFHCAPVEATYSHSVKRFVLSGQKLIPNQFNPSEGFKDFEFQVGDVYTINTVMSSGPGKVKDSGDKVCIYQRDVNCKYHPKLNSAKQLWAKITKQFPVFPFTIKSIADLRLRLGLSELVNHGLLIPFPILTERKDHFVAQFQTTVVVTLDGPVCLTPAADMSFVHSTYNIPSDASAAKLMNQCIDIAKLPELPVLTNQPVLKGSSMDVA